MSRSIVPLLKGFAGYKPVAAYKLHTDDMDLKNTYEDDEKLIPVKEEDYTFEDGELKLHVKPLSWNVYVFEA